MLKIDKVSLLEELENYYQLDLITSKKIANILIGGTYKEIIEIICEYELFEYLYMFNEDISYTDFFKYCGGRIEEILLNNYANFNGELFFFFLYQHDYEFSVEFISLIIKKKHNNSIYHILMEDRTETTENIENMFKLEEVRKQIIKRNENIGDSLDLSKKK